LVRPDSGIADMKAVVERLRKDPGCGKRAS